MKENSSLISIFSLRSLFFHLSLSLLTAVVQLLLFNSERLPYCCCTQNINKTLQKELHGVEKRNKEKRAQYHMCAFYTFSTLLSSQFRELSVARCASGRATGTRPLSPAFLLIETSVTDRDEWQKRHTHII